MNFHCHRKNLYQFQKVFLSLSLLAELKLRGRLNLRKVFSTLASSDVLCLTCVRKVLPRFVKRRWLFSNWQNFNSRLISRSETIIQKSKLRTIGNIHFLQWFFWNFFAEYFGITTILFIQCVGESSVVESLVEMSFFHQWARFQLGVLSLHF